MSAITPAKGLHTLLIDAQRILGGPSGRQRAAVAQQVEHKLLQLRSGRRCERCWLASAHCVCHQLQPLAPLQSVRRVFTVLSARELGSVANSCATFHAACPEHARWAVAGLPGEAWAEVPAIRKNEIYRTLMDVDHKDGNHENNHPDNLQTLCKFCHGVKTVMEQDSVNRKYQK